MVATKLRLDDVTTEHFLHDVVPADGTTVIGWLEGDKFKQSTPATLDEAAEQLRQHSFRKRDAYHALASYKQGKHLAPDGNYRVRYQDNVKSLKAFWLDIDTGDKKGYPDHAAALAALVDFINRNAFPQPKYIVNSGGGIHVYWCLASPIPLNQWQGVAVALKQACVSKGLKIDPKCTADAARVLRPIGTRNYKKDPRQVTLFRAIKEFITLEDMKKAVEPWMDPLDDLPSYIQPIRTNDELSAGVGGKIAESKAERLVERCGVMKHIAETRGAECSEPMWTATLQLLRFCSDGTEYVHAMSDGHPGYDQHATDKKYAERLTNDAGPTVCATFQEEYSHICEDCPVYNKVKTPLVLGTENYRDPHQMPRHFRANGSITEKFTAGKEDDDEAEWKYAFGFVIESMKFSRLPDKSGTVIGVSARSGTTEDSRVFMEIPMGILGNMSKLNEFLGDYGMLLKHKKEHDRLTELLVSWSKQLVEASQVEYACEHLGWQANHEFATAHLTFNTKGQHGHGVRPNPQYNDLLRQYIPAGSLEGWQEPMDFLCKQGRPDLLTLVSVAFAAPLIRFTGQSGLLISAVSEMSGVGKTSAIYVGQSVWGHPKAIASVDDTQNAVVTRMGLLNSLPAYWDEIRGEKSMQNMVNIAFRISEGKDKARLTQSAKMRETKAWNTMMATASNSSLMDYIEHYDQHTDAGLRRVFEFSADTVIPPEAKSNIFSQCMENYGHAGAKYAEFLGASRERVKDEYDALVTAIEKHTNAESAERFWTAGVSCLLLGAKYANELKLAAFPMKQLRDFLLNALLHLRERVSDTTSNRTPVGSLAAYCNAHLHGRLVTDELGDRSNKNIALKQSPTMNTALYQVASKDKEALIQVSDFKHWLEKNRLPLSIVKQVKALPYVDYVKKSIGSYTPFTTAQVWCYKVDLTAEPMLETLAYEPDTALGI